MNNKLSKVAEFSKKFYGQQSDAIIAGVLLIAMAIVLSMPTIKPLRTIEVKPKNASLLLTSGVSMVNDVRVPAGQLSYFIAWVQEGQVGSQPKSSDYKTTTLEVKSGDGGVLREATNPKLITKDDKSALLFEFNAIKTNGNEHLTFVLQQKGKGAVMLRYPLTDNIKSGEAAAVAFQLGEKKNWLTLLIDKVYAEDLAGQDIAAYLHRGQQIVAGENPYLCVLELASCVGYPAHLPGMYLVSAGFVALGVNDLATLAIVWRPIVFAAWFGVGIILFIYIYRRKQPALAVAALGFWLFNRWSIDVLRIAHTDFLGVFFLLLAVVLARRWPKTAAILFGVSLAIKQLAILVVPIFLLYMWRQKKFRPMALIILTGLIVLVPLLTVLPFLINNPRATIQGLLFVVERPAQSVHGFAPSLDSWLDVTGVGKSLIMLFFIGTVYVAAWRKSVDLIGGILMVLAIIMAFTSVLYNQYFIWFLPFIPLAVADIKRHRKKNHPN